MLNDKVTELTQDQAMKEQIKETPKSELMERALEHYEEASSAIHHFNSDIPKAIKQYYTSQELSDDEIDELKQLREHQSNPRRFLSQEEFDRIGELARKQHHFYTHHPQVTAEMVMEIVKLYDKNRLDKKYCYWEWSSIAKDIATELTKD